MNKYDLTGQVVSKVVTLAGDLETSLVQLLVEVVVVMVRVRRPLVVPLMFRRVSSVLRI